MKDLKKLMAICICAMTLVFGVLVIVEEMDMFKLLGSLSFADRASAGASVLVIAYLVINVMLVLYPLINMLLVIFDKKVGGPYRAITSCALIIVAKYLFILFAIIVSMIIAGDSWESWKAFLFNPTMAIIPIVIFLGGYIFVLLSSIKPSKA